MQQFSEFRITTRISFAIVAAQALVTSTVTHAKTARLKGEKDADGLTRLGIYETRPGEMYSVTVKDCKTCKRSIKVE